MRMLRKLMLVGSMAIATASTPVLAQQGQQQMPMMGQHGMMQGSQGMMGQSANPGMMGSCPMMGGMMGQGMMGPGMGMMMGSGPMMGLMMGTGPMMEGRLAYLKAELGSTDAQTSAWDDYVAAVKARHSGMQDMHAGMIKAMHSGNAVDRLDAHVKAMESMVESLKALKPPTVALYAVLSDDQKKKADQLLGGCCGMM
jgi:hypothetical protein